MLVVFRTVEVLVKVGLVPPTMVVTVEVILLVMTEVSVSGLTSSLVLVR